MQGLGLAAHGGHARFGLLPNLKALESYVRMPGGAGARPGLLGCWGWGCRNARAGCGMMRVLGEMPVPQKATQMATSICACVLAGASL